jgi:hypothetical protein
MYPQKKPVVVIIANFLARMDFLKTKNQIVEYAP